MPLLGVIKNNSACGITLVFSGALRSSNLRAAPIARPLQHLVVLPGERHFQAS